MTIHKPVLMKETLEYLNPQSGENFIDATLGGGGHAQEILKLTGPDGKLLGIDQDQNAIDRFYSVIQDLNLKDRVTLVRSNFEHIQDIVANQFSYAVAGILLDIGFSSDQLEKSGRGFSFKLDEPLDMRMNTDKKKTAADIVNSLSASELERLFRVYGEEDQARQISEAIVKLRKREKIATTFQLRKIVASVKNPHSGFMSQSRNDARRAAMGLSSEKRAPRFGKIDPATKVFQALRIKVNKELDVLESVLPQALQILAPGGRLVVISFHGLEDKIVKNFIKDNKSNIKSYTKKPITASGQELRKNPRARSARLRAITKI